ncbi:MAG: hypothetical protein IJU19_08070 [Bacteroidales bacterium]|nr:hypothetical protein [Bacteroidales bacterium]
MKCGIGRAAIIGFGLIFCLQFPMVGLTHAQVVPDGYRHQKQLEQSQYRDSTREGFLRYVEQVWREYRLFEGEHSPQSVKPAGQPHIDTARWEGDTLTAEHRASHGELDTAERIGMAKALPPTAATDTPLRVYAVPFYGRRLEISLPENIAGVALGGVGERQVARYWKRLDGERADQCIASLDRHRHDLYLGDWGLFDLIRHISAAIYPGQPNEQAALGVYLLNAMHYDARLGRVGEQLVMLIPTGSRLYDIPYIELGNTRYYAFGEFPRKGKLRSYERQPAYARQTVDMHLEHSPRLGGALATKAYSYAFEGGKVEFRVNQPLIDFYARYPQTELSVYATAAMEEAFAAAVEREMRPMVEGMPPVEALNTLLEFIQHGFAYQADRSQFGREKNFFCEENFYYPANDCEDRAVLFARVVGMLLGYDAVLLAYDDHVATAIRVPGRKVKGYHIELDGKRYMVCDPTYLGATVGDLGRKYRSKRAQIILTK